MQFFFKDYNKYVIVRCVVFIITIFCFQRHDCHTWRNYRDLGSSVHKGEDGGWSYRSKNSNVSKDQRFKHIHNDLANENLKHVILRNQQPVLCMLTDYGWTPWISIHFTINSSWIMIKSFWELISPVACLCMFKTYAFYWNFNLWH